MADTPSNFDPFQELPEPAARADAKEDYARKADALNAALYKLAKRLNVFVAWLNALIAWIVTTRTDMATSQDAAAQSVKDAAGQVKLATDQALASKGSADAAAGSLASVRVVAQAVDAAAGLPPANLPGGVLRQALDGSGKKEWWLPILSQVGDTIVSTQAPSSAWIPTGRTYNQSLYPDLYAKLGIIADWSYTASSASSSNTSSYNVTAIASAYGVTIGLAGNYCFVSSDYFASYDVYSSPVNVNWNCIEVGFNLFLAAGNQGGGVWYSSNGRGNWSQSTGHPAGTNSAWCKMGSNIAIYTVFNQTAYATSTDGKVWTSRTLPFTPSNNQPMFTKGVFAILSTAFAVWTSSDGINWTNRGALPITLATNFTWGTSPDGFLIMDSGGQCAFSSDGITWTTGARFILPVSGFGSLSGGQGGFIFQQANSSLYMTTVDGSKWFTRNLGYATNSVNFGGKVYVPAIRAHIFVGYPTSSFIIRIKALSYDPAVQFYSTDPANVSQGLNQYIRGV